MVTVIGALRSFDLVATMTAGGPWGSSTVLAYMMYEESIFNYRMGYGAAVAVVLFLIMAVYITYFLVRMLRSETIMFPKPIERSSRFINIIYRVSLPITILLWLLPLAAVMMTSVRFNPRY